MTEPHNGLSAASKHEPVLKKLRFTRNVMKTARKDGKSYLMSIWEQDLEGVEEAIKILSSDGGVESGHATASGSGPLPEPTPNGDACSALEPPHQAAETVGRQQELKRAAGVTTGPSDHTLHVSQGNALTARDMLLKVLRQYGGEPYSLVAIDAAWNAAIDTFAPAQSVRVPDGWKLVPVDPTQEMVRHAYAAQPGAINAGFAQAYRDMLEAAPYASQPSPAAPVEPTFHPATGERDNEETDPAYFHSSAGNWDEECERIEKDFYAKVGRYCTFGPPAERKRQWIILFEDADRGLMVFEDEREAHTAWDRAKDNWTCTLYETAHRKFVFAAGQLRPLNEPQAARYVYQCWNPECDAIWDENPNGHCPKCKRADGGGSSTICRTLMSLPSSQLTRPQLGGGK